MLILPLLAKYKIKSVDEKVNSKACSIIHPNGLSLRYVFLFGTQSFQHLLKFKFNPCTCLNIHLYTHSQCGFMFNKVFINCINKQEKISVWFFLLTCG